MYTYAFWVLGNSDFVAPRQSEKATCFVGSKRAYFLRAARVLILRAASVPREH